MKKLILLTALITGATAASAPTRASDQTVGYLSSTKKVLMYQTKAFYGKAMVGSLATAATIYCLCIIVAELYNQAYKLWHKETTYEKVKSYFKFEKDATWKDWGVYALEAFVFCVAARMTYFMVIATAATFSLINQGANETILSV